MYSNFSDDRLSFSKKYLFRFSFKFQIPIRDFGLELWPGYVTSIRQHEYDILLCAEISSKVMRNETLLDIYSDCVRNFRDSREAYAQAIIGTTVLTDYSNKTYRIDDIDWDRSPSHTFNTREGDISFIEYYRKVSYDF